VGPEDAGVSVVSVLRLPVSAGAGDALAEAYVRLGIFALARDSGGFLGGRLLKPLAGDAPFLVVAEWEDAAAYDRWLASPVRAGLAAELDRLVAGPVGAAVVYEDVVHG
jgi:heme-degrading monooxygenase HmoA